VIGSTETRINALNMGMDYEFAVYPYGPGGLGSRSAVIAAPATVPKPVLPVPIQPVEGFPVYEAKDAQLGGGAVLRDDALAFGGRTIQDMHWSGAFFQINNIDGGPGGGSGTDSDAVLRLVYSNGNFQARTQVMLNGVSIGTLTLPGTGGWNNFTEREFPISGLTPGETNTLRFIGGQEGFNTDYFQILYGGN
jgi:hypothetical protein